MQYFAQHSGMQQPMRCGRLRYAASRSVQQPFLVQQHQQPLPTSSHLKLQSAVQQAALQQLPAAEPPCSKSNSSRSLGSKHVCAAAAGDSSTPVSSPISAQLEQVAATCDVFYRFTRPHTMLGTFVSIVSVSIMAMQSFTWTSAAVAGLLQALAPALLMNVAIVGINQLYDIDIDKVNKPYLPLASGELSMQQGARQERLGTCAAQCAECAVSRQHGRRHGMLVGRLAAVWSCVSTGAATTTGQLRA
jgi:hypothetical protein